MPKAHQDWTVLDYEPIVKLAENLWWVRGAIPGMSLKRVMVVARLSDGRLALHSPIALNPQDMAEIEAFGTPAFILVPNGGHRLDAPAYKKRYPAARLLAPRGSRDKVEEVVPVDGTYEDFPEDPSVRLEALDGLGDLEGLMVVRSNDGVSLVFTDAVFNMDRKRDPLGFFFTTLLGSAPGPRVSRLAKLLFVKDKAAFRAALLRLADTPGLVRVIVAHEKVASGPDARAEQRRAAEYV
jgi:hypothetical protein